MRKTQLTYLLLCWLIIGCNAPSEKQQPLSMEEFAGEIGEEIQEEEQIDTTTNLPKGIFEQLIANQLGLYDTVELNAFHPMDRFTFNHQKKVTLKSKKTISSKADQITPTAALYYYTFSDTLKTKNALYNWLDCFGPNCEMVQLNEDNDTIKMPPLFSVVYDTTLVIANYRCEDNAFDWKPLQDSIIQCFGKNYTYRIEVGCEGPLRWK